MTGGGGKSRRQGDRFVYLDGCRGVAALFVANFHWLCAFAPQFISEYSERPMWISDTPLAIVYNGGFAVSIFFVLSGFVISNSASRRHLPLVFNVAQRYCRLAFPSLASVLFALAMLKYFNGTVHELRVAVASAWLNFVYDGEIPGLAHAMRNGLGDVFVFGESHYNNVLWTMQIELLGSWLVYAVYSASNKIVLSEVAILVLLLALGRFELASFVCGAMLREAVVAGRPPIIAPRLMLALGLFLGSMMKGYGDRVLTHFTYFPFRDHLMHGGSFALGEPHRFWHLVGATLVMYGVLTVRSIQTWLSSAVLTFAGRISFGFYLVHVVLIYTIIGRIFLYFDRTHGSSLLVYVAFISLSTVVGYVFCVCIDEPVVRTIRKVQRLVRTAVSDSVVIPPSRPADPAG